MALRQDIKPLVEVWKNSSGVLGHNYCLFDIFEGNLLPYVLDDLEKQLSENSFNQIKHRVAPINVLKRLIDKLSKIYAKAPQREIINISNHEPSKAPKDKDLLSFYVRSLDINTNMGLANEFFNLFKNCLIEPFLDKGKPKLRVIPSDRFFVYSNDPVNPLNVTHLVKIMGKYKDIDGTENMLFYAYTADEFLVFNDKEQVVESKMAEVYANAPSEYGKNPYGAIPGVYVNRSKHQLIPSIDTDTLQMTKLLPVLLSDANFCVMFQAFSIVYGIDLDEEQMKMAPNAFWRFKSNPNNPDARPSVGVIKPEADVDKMLSLIHAQLAFWLNSRNIKPGAIGVINSENFSSGIAKAIDEMDTSEDRQKQVPYFMEAENQLWDLIFNHMHPVWLSQPDFAYKVAVSANIGVQTTFAEQRPLVDTSTVIDDCIKMLDKALESRKGALKRINPDWPEDQVEEKIKEIDDEREAAALDAGDGENPNQDPNKPASGAGGVPSESGKQN